MEHFQRSQYVSLWLKKHWSKPDNSPCTKWGRWTMCNSTHCCNHNPLTGTLNPLTGTLGEPYLLLIKSYTRGMMSCVAPPPRLPHPAAARSRAQLSCYWTSCSSRTGKRRMLQVRNRWRTGPEWIQRWSTLTPWRRRRALPTWLGMRTRIVVPRGRTGDPWAVEKEPNLTLAPDNVCQCPLPSVTLVTWETKTLPRYSKRAHTKIPFLSNGDSAAQEACTHKKIFKH